MSPFEILNGVDVSGHTEKKGNLTYLSWAWAWGELKKRYPMSYYTVYEAANGNPYHTDGKTCWVKTGVTLVDGDTSLEHIEYLPVMDARNHSIPLAQVDSFAVNKTIQRSLTKAIARHGLGLYIYAGEDLPEDPPAQKKPPEGEQNQQETEQKKQTGTPANQSDAVPIYCTACGNEITPYGNRTAQELAKASKEKFGEVLCVDCGKDEAARRSAGDRL